MKLKEELLKLFPFLKTKTAKYLLIFSLIRKLAALIFVLIYFY
jgi:hypothetical protein